MGRLENTWHLMGASWDVLKQDRELLIFPLLSGLSCLLVLLSFALPLLGAGFAEESLGFFGSTLSYVVTFLFYLVNYTVITFFNAAVVACAAIRMQGGNPTVSDGFRAALARLPLILGWAAVAATVGMVLRVIEERSEFLGKLVAGLLGMAWTLTSFLVVPVLVIDNKGPFEALQQSGRYLKKSWGEQVVGNFSFGLVFFFLSLPGFLPIVVGFLSGSMSMLVVCIGLAVVYWIGLSLVQSVLQSIFQTALFLYLKSETAPRGYPESLLSGAMTRR